MDFEMRLDYQDSNLDKQNQNLLCYHYTIVQTLGLSVKKRCKDRELSAYLQTFGCFFIKKGADYAKLHGSLGRSVREIRVIRAQ